MQHQQKLWQGIGEMNDSSRPATTVAAFVPGWASGSTKDACLPMRFMGAC